MRRHEDLGPSLGRHEDLGHEDLGPSLGLLQG